jgi:DNA polymerase
MMIGRNPMTTKTWQDQLAIAGFPADAVVLDFETYFDAEYSLKKLSAIEFVMDSRFEVTGLGYQFPGSIEGGAAFAPPDDVGECLGYCVEIYGPNLSGCTVVVANGKFDCLVLREKYGITPQYVVDVQDLGRNMDARDRHDIEYMAKKYKAPRPKGGTMQFSGLHWTSMTPKQRTALAEYCSTDIEIETHLFKLLLPCIVCPGTELRLSNQTLRLFLEDNIRVNFALGEQLVAEMESQVQKELDTLRAVGVLCVEPPKFYKRGLPKPPTVRPATPADIRSDDKFVAMLEDALPEGEAVPMKQGKKKLIPALAKSDEALSYLLVHPKPKVRALVEARVACKSWPAHIKRVRRIMDQARARGGCTGLPLTYYAAHTGRFGGTGGWNPQNLGARDVHPLIKQVGTMLEAPDGFVFGSGDLSQIEARVVAWLSGQGDLVRGFANNEDIYSELAQNTIFHKETYKKPKPGDSPETIKAMKTRRDFGKMAILACGFGMGGDTFYARSIVKPELRPAFLSGEIDRGFCRHVVCGYRQRYPHIVAYWYEVEKAWRFVTKYPTQTAVVSHNGHGVRFSHRRGTTVITLPSDRELYYPMARVDSEGACSYRWGYVYGGLLVENIVQATARDVFTAGLLRIEDAGFILIGHIHDQAISLLPTDGTENANLAEIHRLQTEPLPWTGGLPVATEGELSKTYKKSEDE